MSETTNPGVNDGVETVARAAYRGWNEHFGDADAAPTWDDLSGWSKAPRLSAARHAIVAVRQWEADHRCVACDEPHAALGAAFGPGCHP